MTGSSAVSNLAVTNSAIVFAPPGSSAAFKTLTVGSYVGTGANLTMNTALGGTGSASDQLAINGGSATGSNFLTIHNVGGAGAQTTGNGIPVVVVSNGGTTASNAFALANTPVVGGFRYSLEDTNNDWYLVSSPTSTQSDIANSVNNVAKSQQQLITTNRILDSILIGATEQVNCSNCSSGFGLVGSYALGAHGRHSLTDELTVIGGFSYGEYSADGVTVSNAPSIAGSLIYDFVNWGRSRPFVEVGGGATPFEDVKYSRSYANGATTGTGYGEAVNRNLGIFGRVGWVDRLTPIDEAAVYGDISRSWMIAGGYTEGAGPGNPYPATVQTGLDTLNVARAGGQYTHLFNGNIEVNVSAAVAYGFGAGSGNQFSVVDFGTIAPYPIANSYWLEYGGRVGYRLPNKMVLDAFLLGTAFGEIGKTLHGGVGLRLFSELQPRNGAGVRRLGEDSNGPRSHGDRAFRQEPPPLFILSGVRRRGRDADHLRARLAGAFDFLARTASRLRRTRLSRNRARHARLRPLERPAATGGLRARTDRRRHDRTSRLHRRAQGDLGRTRLGGACRLVDCAAPRRALPRRRQSLRSVHPRGFCRSHHPAARRSRALPRGQVSVRAVGLSDLLRGELRARELRF